MLLIRKWILIITLIIAAGTVVGFGVWKYKSVTDYAAMEKELIKVAAENFLFTAVTASAVLLVLLAALLGRSVRINREMDKLIQLMRRGEYNSGMSFNRLGAFGDKLQALFYHLEKLNEGKTQKISSLSFIVSFLMNNMDLPILILDVTGNLESASRAFLNSWEKKEELPAGKNIEDIFLGIQFQTILSDLRESRQIQKVEENKSIYSFVPFFNKNHELSNIICVPGEHEIYSEREREQVEKRDRMGKLTKFIRQQWSRRKQRPSRSDSL